MTTARAAATMPSMHEIRRSVAQLLLAAIVAVAACGGPRASTTPDNSGAASQSPAASGVLAALPDGTVDAPALDALEAELERSAMAGAGLLEKLGGDAMLDRINELRRSAAAAAASDLLGQPVTGRTADPLAGQVASVGAAVPPATALGGIDFSGSLVMTSVYTNLILQQSPPTGQGSNRSSTSQESGRITAGGHTANVTIQTTLSIVRNGSTITGAADVITTIALLDANGNVTETVTTTSHGVVEVDTCPADDGSVNADYALDYQVSSTGGSSAEYHVSGRVVGQVLDDAYLHGFNVDASGSVTNNAGVDRAVTIQATAAMTGAPGNVTALTIGATSGSTVRADPATTSADLTELMRLAAKPAFEIVALLFDTAQSQWRGGVCVEVEVTPESRDVQPNASLQLFVDIKHKMTGQILRGLPVKGSMTGGRSFTVADTDLPTPRGFAYVATGHLGDVGKVHFISTSRRGIGTRDVEYRVATDLVLELAIDSTFQFTKYNGLLTDAKAHVEGKIRMAYDEARGTWSGNGFLRSTTTSSPPGCNATSINGSGNRYDWVVREARAAPGMADSDLEVWMDAGPAPESFDAFVARYCPVPTLTGTVNTWENIFFLIESPTYYGAKGLHVTGFDALGVDTSVWYDGLVLGKIGWHGDCSQIQAPPLPSGIPDPGVSIKDLTLCSGDTWYTLRVIDPALAPPP